MVIDTRGERAEGHAAVARPRGDRTDVLDLAPGVKIEIAMCEQHIDESVGDGFETAISRDDRRPAVDPRGAAADRSEEHTSELQSLMRTSYADFCLKKKKKKK